MSNKDILQLCFGNLLRRRTRTILSVIGVVIGTTAVIEEVRWLTVLSASALAGLLSLLTSIATGLPEVEDTDKGEDDLDPYRHDHPPDGTITVLAYEDYDEDGNPVVEEPDKWGVCGLFQGTKGAEDNADR